MTIYTGQAAARAYVTGMNETSVIYNGSCPICSTEVSAYRRHAEAEGLPLAFHDLTTCDLAPYGLSKDDAARRLYVLHQGTMTSGVDAFLILWREMPKFRWLSRIVGLPGVRHLARPVYDYILAPALYALHRRRQRA